MTSYDQMTEKEFAACKPPYNYSYDRVRKAFYNHNCDHWIGITSPFHKIWISRSEEFPIWTAKGPAADAMAQEKTTAELHRHILGCVALKLLSYGDMLNSSGEVQVDKIEEVLDNLIKDRDYQNRLYHKTLSDFDDACLERNKAFNKIAELEREVKSLNDIIDKQMQENEQLRHEIEVLTKDKETLIHNCNKYSNECVKLEREVKRLNLLQKHYERLSEARLLEIKQLRKCVANARNQLDLQVQLGETPKVEDGPMGVMPYCWDPKPVKGDKGD